MQNRLSTGIDGLDEVLLGGLLAGHSYMVRGLPGAGKTTMALQFLIDGAARGERVLFVTLSESEAELRSNAGSHGWDLGGVDILDIHPAEGFGQDNQYTIFHPADVELAPVARRIDETIDRIGPTRVALDSLTEVRLLSRDPLRYRRQLLMLKNHLLSRGITTLFLGESARQELDVEVASIVHGVIALNLTKGRDGASRRSIEVEKYRASAFREGEHPFRIEHGGLVVYPRLIARDHGLDDFDRERAASGVVGLDEMLSGGLDRGTSTIFTGNAGVGKTTLCMGFFLTAARAGLRGVIYTFDEGVDEIIDRCEALGMPVRATIADGLLAIRKVNPLLLYPDEFASWIREEVETRGTRLLMIDSLNGYRQSMPEEGYLVGHMHQLLTYLNQMGVTTIATNEVSNLTGDFAATQFGLSHLADCVVVLKYYEYAGSLHKAIGILKKRLGDHEKIFREFAITPSGPVVGGPLPRLRGILRGEGQIEGSESRDTAGGGRHG